MNLFISILLLIVIAVTSCKKDNAFCGVGDPINEIEWLQDYKTDPYLVHCEIYKATYNNVDGFYLDMYFDSAYYNKLSAFKNCKGENICRWGGALAPNCPDYKDYETYRELIYSR